MDLDEKRERAERDIEMVTYFASFYGNSIFTIFYNDLRMLKWIADQLERTEFPRESRLDDYGLKVEVEN